MKQQSPQQQPKEVAQPAQTLPAEASRERGLAQIFSFSSFGEALKAAELIQNTAMVPKQFQGKAAEILACWQYGMELGLPPMQALTAIAIINGRPSLYGDAFMAVIQTNAEFESCVEEFDNESQTALCCMRRRGKPDVVRTFSMADAQKAKLAGKEGPWTLYPKRMLQMRARGFAGRDQFADALRGMAIAEEVRDTPEEREVAGEVVTRAPIGPGTQGLLNALKPAAVANPPPAVTVNPEPIVATQAPAPTTQQDLATASPGPGVAVPFNAASLIEQAGKAKDGDDLNEVLDLARDLPPDAKQEVARAVRERSKALKGAQ